ncbi:hypothetical protein [Acidovorax sp. SUPP3334]|uniref:hypothetical protein n=1 Tax=Acidovorax sp. SUPP3334 TaxID=2920881 RepID=UPI0023DE6566|nr:hypothetical protein [Acidovorax sp. SUPP3334]GKT22154.1 hypothetical protein AVHM3334_07365 [Acidovorax sp. SUPP3334]
MAKPLVPSLPGTIIAGGPLSQSTIIEVNKAATKARAEFRRFVAYANTVKVGGSLAWRANNPGNLRDSPLKIGIVTGGVGVFAVFESMNDGHAAQRLLYVKKYGAMKVRDAIAKLTPPNENDTDRYLKQLEEAGVDLDKDVNSQIDVLMPAVAASEGVIAGIEVPRS